MVRMVMVILLLAHGVGHVMGFLDAWTTVPVGFSDTPWFLGGDTVMDSAVGRAFGLLWLVVMLAFVAAGLGLAARQPWWPSLVVAAAVLSLAVILPWWSTVAPGARVGATLVDLGLIVLLTLPVNQFIEDALK